MLEFLLALGLWGSFVGLAIATVAILIAIFIADYHENGWWITISLVAYFGLFWLGNKETATFQNMFSWFSWSLLVYYLVSGFIYAGIKTYFKGKKSREKSEGYMSKGKTIEQEREFFINQRKEFKSELKNNVFRWWLAWPISLINWILTDLLRDFWNLVWKKFKSLFEGIFDAGFGKIPEVPEEETKEETKEE